MKPYFLQLTLPMLLFFISIKWSQAYTKEEDDKYQTCKSKCGLPQNGEEQRMECAKDNRFYLTECHRKCRGVEKARNNVGCYCEQCKEQDYWCDEKMERRPVSECEEKVCSGKEVLYNCEEEQNMMLNMGFG